MVCFRSETSKHLDQNHLRSIFVLQISLNHLIQTAFESRRHSIRQPGVVRGGTTDPTDLLGHQATCGQIRLRRDGDQIGDSTPTNLSSKSSSGKECSLLFFGKVDSIYLSYCVLLEQVMSFRLHFELLEDL